MRNIIKGISAVNPVDVERDYLLFTVDYCISHNNDYKGTASSFDVSYSQVYSWVKKYMYV